VRSGGETLYEETSYPSGQLTRQHFVYGENGLIAIVSGSASALTRSYSHADYIGSVVANSDDGGQLTERAKYDPYGERSATGSSAPSADLDVVGFTGHEHLLNVGLIDMKGRIYDPVLGKFMSPDPLIQSPSNLQSYNRYSYVWNNPVNLIDPTGYQAASFDGNPWSIPNEQTNFIYHFKSVSDSQLSQGNPSVVATNGGSNGVNEIWQVLNYTGRSKKSGNFDEKGRAAVVADSRWRLNTWEEIGANFKGAVFDDPMIRAAGVGLASLVATGWGAITGNDALVDAGVDGARDLNLSNRDGLQMAMGLALGGRARSGVPGPEFVPSELVTGPYVRLRAAGPTPEQRASVQGKPCVDCGAVTSNQVADHIEPLVVQHYRTGSVDVQQQRSIDAVQPHCPACSAAQGGQLGFFAKLMKNYFGF
jgi:RHS repeat-associated protein